MTFKLEFETDNDAFRPSPRMEIAGVLREVVKAVDEGASEGKCHDSNGNTIGAWEFTGDESEIGRA